MWFRDERRKRPLFESRIIHVIPCVELQTLPYHHILYYEKVSNVTNPMFHGKVSKQKKNHSRAIDNNHFGKRKLAERLHEVKN